MVLLASGATRIFGQATEFGTINGTVTDPAGSVIRNAKVTATDIAKGESYTAKTNSSGLYIVPNLLPAEYNLTIEAPGFKTVTIAPFKLDVGQTLTQNRTLPIGQSSQRVEVHAQGQLLQTTVVSNSTTIEAAQINDLPLNGRNYTSLIDLTPGADGTRINGQFADANRYVLDGANNTDLRGGGSTYVPNLDLIQEFSIDSHTTQAENGGFLGSTVSVATKSGTNHLHGDLFEFNRTSEFEAKNPYNPTVSPNHYNQFGGTVGGPVYLPKIYNGHDRTFFFFGYQGTRDSQKAYTYTRVPTADELNGDFHNSLFFLNSPVTQHLYNPATTTTGPNPSRMPFPDDTFTPDPLMQAYFKFVEPVPNFTPTAQHPTVNRLDIYGNPTVINDYSIRIDQRISSKDNIWGRYSQVGNSVTSNQTPVVTQPVLQNRKNLIVDWIHMFTPKLFVESNYSYLVFPYSINDGLPPNYRSGLIAAGFNASQIALYNLPDMLYTEASTPYFITDFTINERSPFSLNESLSWTAGNHTMKFGVNLSHKHFENTVSGHHFLFSTVQTQDPSNPSVTGLAFASAMLGLPYGISTGYSHYIESYLNWAAYAEDQWKVRPNITISVGLRYDNFPTPNYTLGANELNDWDFNNGIWYIGGGKVPPPCNTSGKAPCIPGDGNIADLPYGNMIQLAKYPGIRYPLHDNFGPRIGVAWNVLKNTVIRAGYGIYYDPESETAVENQNTFGSWPSANTLTSQFNQIGQSLTTVNEIDGQDVNPLPPLVPWGTSTSFWDPHKKDPKSQQWNADLQQQFLREWLVDLAYVGSHNTRNDMTLDANAAITPSTDPSTINARRKWPFYGSDTMFGTDLGLSNYNALQLKINRRFSNGLQMLIAYTWAKTMDNGEDGWFSGHPQNSYDLNANYGISDADRRQILSTEAIYQLPFGKTRRWLNHGAAAYILGNFQLNAIGTAESGNPIILTASGDPAHIGNTQYNYERLDIVGNPRVTHQSGAQWFNQAAFKVPDGAFGTAPRGLFTQPNYQNLDLSIFKNVPLHNSLSLQLRLEAFNALNLIMRGAVDGNISDTATFGKIYSIGNTPRQLQLAAKFYF